MALGGSAGSLAAIEQFFKQVPADSGLAFVVITHQAPKNIGLLAQLVARHTALPVSTIEHGMALKPNQIYVAPPAQTLSFRGELMQLTAADEPRAAALPIDRAFRSLAQNHGDRSIVVVLSGHGSDGSLGLTDVKGAYGMVLAQEPSTAESASMPSSAIATYLVDYVLPPAQMPGQILRYVQNHLTDRSFAFQPDSPATDSALHKILHVLRARTGNDFSAYKKSTIRRRIERRMHVNSLSSPEEYASLLDQAAYEVDALFKELLISVTSFFRDSQAFDVLSHELTRLVELKTDAQPLRAWIAGCATGEEAYSIAIVFKEVLERSGKELKVQIFATDLDQQAVDIARNGRYPEGISADLTPERLERFFTREDTSYRVNKDVRELIIFAVQNAIKDPPFTKLDLLSCRNLMIYLESGLQKRVLSLFSYSLRPGGLLLLGTSESVSGFEDRFLVLDRRWKLFQRLSTVGTQSLLDLFPDRESTFADPHGLMPEPQRAGHPVTNIAERLLLASFVPPSVIASERGEIIYIQGRVGMFFEPAQGAPTQNVFSMAREGLRAELPAAVRRAARSTKAVVRPGLLVKTNGSYTAVTLTVRRLSGPAPLRGNFLISFENTPENAAAPKRPSKKRTTSSPERVTTLEEELQRTRENLQGMIEELETSNEELKSTNEELQSTNEELQSTNEELETSREEMQSLNEELQTVNTELEERNRALSQANDDMQNLLNSTEVATVFLDEKLHIKRFTKQAKKVFSLIDSDIGRPISDLAANLRYEGLLSDAQYVLSTLSYREREIQTKQGSWRLMRIMPYRTHENLIDGLVMTFVDIDRLKGAQRSAPLRLASDEILRTGILVVDAAHDVLMVNKAFCTMFGITELSPIGQTLATLARNSRDLPQLGSLCDQLLEGDAAGEQSLPELRLDVPDYGTAILSINAKRLPDSPEHPAQVLLMFERPDLET